MRNPFSESGRTEANPLIPLFPEAGRVETYPLISLFPEAGRVEAGKCIFS